MSRRPTELDFTGEYRRHLAACRKDTDAIEAFPWDLLEGLTDHPEAKCLDGTPALYYLRAATSAVNATKWSIHIQGGGWCSSPKTCASRAQSRLGSSAKQYNNNETMVRRFAEPPGWGKRVFMDTSFLLPHLAQAYVTAGRSRDAI